MIVSDKHIHLVNFYGTFTGCMRQCSPYTRSFAKALNILNVTVCKCPELFNDLLICIRILICSNVYPRPAKDRIIPS